MIFKTSGIDPELQELLAKAQARYEAMTPKEQQEMWRAQRRSWVRGELMLGNTEMTFEEADRRAREAENYCMRADRPPAIEEV